MLFHENGKKNKTSKIYSKKNYIQKIDLKLH